MQADHSIGRKPIAAQRPAEARRLLALTEFRKTVVRGKRQCINWSALVSLLQSTMKTNASKDACPLVRFGTFERNSRASGSALLTLDALQADYDAGVMPVAEAAERLRAAGIRAAIYTSANHMVLDLPKYNGGPRWRVVAPLSASIDETQHEALMSLLNGALGGVLASESWEWARCYYMGRVKGIGYEFEEIDGECIDLVALCPDFDPIAPVKAPKPTRKIDRSMSVTDDPVVEYMRKHWDITGGAPGKVFVRCPKADQHGPDTGASSTAWLLATSSEPAHFSCRHTSHGPIGDTDFLGLIGYIRAEAMDEFDGSAALANATEAAEAAATAIRNAQKTAQHGPVSVTDSVTGEVLDVVSPAFSDDQLALQFAGRAAAGLRVSPGMGWMINDGQVWRRDEHLHRFSLARTLCRDAARLSDKATEARALASARTINAVVSLSQSDTRLMVPVSEWDSDGMLLNTPDAIVDLRTAQLAPRRGQLVTRCTRVTPTPGRPCPAWLGFLRAVFRGDDETIGFVQRLLGYMLTGDRREQKLFFFWGEGSNGKSTLADLVLWLLGSYGLKLSSSVLMQSAHEKHPTELAQLQGIRLAMSSELEEGAFFNEARVKELTGDAVLSARFMRGDFFEFEMQHKHLIVGNHRPRLRGGDPAMARRLVLIPFNAVFPEAAQDKGLPEKLKAEGGAILAWIIEGAVEWGRVGLGTPASVLSASAEYLANHDDVQQWLDERCNLSPSESARAGALYSDFMNWKLARGEKAPSITVWGERMALKPGLEKKRSGVVTYAGVSLRPSAAVSSPASVEEFA